MISQPTGVQAGAALALSGGGFRAALFHAGSLLRLNELGLLASLARISSVSGGSITAGLLAARWRALRCAAGKFENLTSELVDPLRAFCRRHVDATAIGEGALLPWKDAATVVQDHYAEHLLGALTLQDLPDSPRFVINATNFQTGRSFRFSKPYAGDYLLGLIEHPSFALALAVAASSAFPPFLSPLELKLPPGSFQRMTGASLNDRQDFTLHLQLTDGGVYDNLGLEPVWNRYQTVYVSDGGAPFAPEPKVGTAWHTQALRAFDIATDQARGLRKRALIADYVRGERTGAYWGIDTNIRAYPLADALGVHADKAHALARLRTRLNPFSEGEQCELINLGYALTDAAVRSHHPPPESPPAAWPYPDYPLS
ncbi:MAG: hypothetical protein JWN04_6485 [Myxococcaceae bacterium]|nr:hypothetical protein [Myxococcaceae bacterium]